MHRGKTMFSAVHIFHAGLKFISPNSKTFNFSAQEDSPKTVFI